MGSLGASIQLAKWKEPAIDPSVQRTGDVPAAKTSIVQVS